jgi:hypothetical protein
MQTTGLLAGATRLIDPAVKQAPDEEATIQFVVSIFGDGFDPPGCTLMDVGTNHPENKSPSASVAMMNASSIGRRPA